MTNNNKPDLRVSNSTNTTRTKLAYTNRQEEAALYELLPAPVRAFYQNAAINWTVQDAYNMIYVHFIPVEEVVELLTTTEAKVLEAERLEVWGTDDLQLKPTRTTTPHACSHRPKSTRNVAERWGAATHNRTT